MKSDNLFKIRYFVWSTQAVIKPYTVQMSTLLSSYLGSGAVDLPNSCVFNTPLIMQVRQKKFTLQAFGHMQCDPWPFFHHNC